MGSDRRAVIKLRPLPGQYVLKLDFYDHYASGREVGDTVAFVKTSTRE